MDVDYEMAKGEADRMEKLLRERDDYKDAADSLGKANDELQKVFEDLVEDMPRENRIEALRAASRIGAGHTASGRVFWIDGERVSMARWTVNAAKTFAKYLEGE